ncbi:MAG TPA: redoxin domain-containing protein, partial [Longimicrobiales bacterium]
MRCLRILCFASILLVSGCDAAAPAARPGAAGTGAAQGAPAAPTAPASPAAPALAGASTRGGHFQLKDAAGSPLVVLFVRGSYCPLCVERLRALASYAGAYGDAGARVVAVTLDPPEVATATARA